MSEVPLLGVWYMRTRAERERRQEVWDPHRQEVWDYRGLGLGHRVRASSRFSGQGIG